MLKFEKVTVAWLQADTKWDPQNITSGGWGGSQNEAYCSVKVLFFCRIALVSLALQPWRPAASQPDTSKLGK